MAPSPKTQPTVTLRSNQNPQHSHDNDSHIFDFSKTLMLPDTRIDTADNFVRINVPCWTSALAAQVYQMILLIAVIRVNCAAATTGTYIYGKYVVSHIALQSDFNRVFQDKGAVFQLSRRGNSIAEEELEWCIFFFFFIDLHHVIVIIIW